MEEIKIGEYVRLDSGNIYKVEDLDDYTFLSDKFYGFIVKHSSNIIDLIEVDDYVNGKKVIGKFYEESLKVLILDTRLNAKCRSKDIKTIVTKEQFANAEYRLEE